jgi:hypothetical protein
LLIPVGAAKAAFPEDEPLGSALVRLFRPEVMEGRMPEVRDGTPEVMDAMLLEIPDATLDKSDVIPLRIEEGSIVLGDRKIRTSSEVEMERRTYGMDTLPVGNSLGSAASEVSSCG